MEQQWISSVCVGRRHGGAKAMKDATEGVEVVSAFSVGGGVFSGEFQNSSLATPVSKFLCLPLAVCPFGNKTTRSVYLGHGSKEQQATDE